MTFEGLLFSALCGTIAAFPLLGNAVFLFLSFQRAAVGYQNVEGNAGFTMVTPSFLAIGGNYSLQSLTISGDGVMGMGGEQIQFVDPEGNSPEYYTWMDASMMGVSGWYDEFYSLTERVVDPSEAFLVKNDAGNFKIGSAGEVDFVGIPALSCNAGFTSVGNHTPVAKALQKFVISGDGVMGMGGEQIQFVDPEGNSPEYYTWMDASMMGVSGWYDEFYSLTEREAIPGEGFLLKNDAGNYVVTVPGTND